MKTAVKKICLAGMVSLMISPAALAELNPEGIWLARNGKAHVKVKNCKTGLCANIVWLKTPTDEYGSALRDKNNPEPSLRKRKIIGLPLFLTMHKTAPSSWEGKVYDPEQGGIFKGYVKTLTPTTMKVWGCLSAGWPCKSYIWKRIK